jgi:hypothetical protein
MRYVFLIFLLLPFFSEAQSGRRKSKVSNSRGTLFGNVGLNQSWYSKSTIKFVGPGYDFSMKGVKAQDDTSYDFYQFGLVQYNARIGYYFRNFFAVSIGLDHMKYGILDKNSILLSGTVNPGIDTVTNYSGTYLNESKIIDSSKFDYRNYGLNYINLKFSRTDQWVKTGNNDWFAVSSDLGIGLGAMLSSTNFSFAGKRDYQTSSLSGFGVSAYAGVRFEFFRHLFVQTGLTGGYIGQFHVRTQESEPNAFAKQKYGFAQFETTIGFLLYVRPTNDCNSCPHW